MADNFHERIAGAAVSGAEVALGFAHEIDEIRKCNPSIRCGDGYHISGEYLDGMAETIRSLARTVLQLSDLVEQELVRPTRAGEA